LQYACTCIGTNGFNIISRVFEGIFQKENSKEFDENALSRENSEGAVGCLFGDKINVNV